MASWKDYLTLCGIDLSTKSIALAFLDDTEACTVELVEPGKYAEDRFDGLILLLEKLLKETSLDGLYVYIEKIPFVKSAKAALDLAAVLGGIRALCAINNVPYVLVNNSVWKKEIGLKGRPSKDDTRDLMAKTYDIILEDYPNFSENQSDALAVATFGALKQGIEIYGINFTGNAIKQGSAKSDVKDADEAVQKGVEDVAS